MVSTNAVKKYATRWKRLTKSRNSKAIVPYKSPMGGVMVPGGKIVGSSEYDMDSVDFGKRKSRRYRKSGERCAGKKKRVCMSNPNCRYTKGRGCRVARGVKKGTRMYEGPSMEFGKKTRKRSFGFGCTPEWYAANAGKGM